jgi:hypothetical protein
MRYHVCISGQSSALLDLFYVLHSCRHKFYVDISKHNYCSAFTDMLLLECRHAAILLQHTFRVHKMKKVMLSYDPVMQVSSAGVGTY